MVARTLKELAAPDPNQQPSCIQYPALNVAFELKSGLIHLLPKFHGLAGEDPHKYLKEFHVVCSSMKPQGVSEDQIKLQAFPFSLEGTAKDWLYYLPSGSVNSWNGMKQIFLEKYFPASRAANIRKEICGIRQYNRESLYEYWERFKKLCASCPHHQISEQLLIQYFYEGLLPMDYSMIDTASGGALVDKTPDEARRLIANMAANSQQLAVGKMQTVKVCGICSGSGHATDMCPALQEDKSMQHINAVGNYGQPQHRYDPFSNTCNPGWRDHPNLSYGNQPVQNRYQQQRTQVNQPLPPPPPSNQGMSLDEMVKALANNTQYKMEAQGSGKLPSQIVMNPRENASAMFCSGKEVYNQTPHKSTKKKKQGEKEFEVPKVEVNTEPKLNKVNNFVLPPFPCRLAKNKKEEQEKDILETFKKVEVNIHLLDAIKQIPRYAKFLKELCTTKRKLRNNEKISVGENVSALIQRKLPPKCKDPGSFSIPCKIGDSRFESAMANLGTSIDVMSNSVFQTLNLGPLKETSVIIQLADRSNAYPLGVVKDVLVQVRGLIFPTDFCILDMEDHSTLSSNSAWILFGRPFLKTAKTKIDVDEGILTMEFDKETVKFNIFDAMKYPADNHSVFSIDVVDTFMQDNFELSMEDELE
ncbi:hypothetical protein P3X46_021650 [Hevea brasiliensis]|uniref:Retrotransposon gag domain-containing protein n=1 Tax=Hevea brasiliensis TaxID=3981 RepID=A0ABQ9LGB3_HEVBR|nr:hypothetical protein P3X46_021650 [Hevea brasiliensis]